MLCFEVCLIRATVFEYNWEGYCNCESRHSFFADQPRHIFSSLLLMICRFLFYFICNHFSVLYTRTRKLHAHIDMDVPVLLMTSVYVPCESTYINR